MNPEEQRLLTAFLDELEKVRDVPKDAAAASLIDAAARRQPDALYLLVRRCLLQDQALTAAQSRIEALQQQIEREKSPVPRSAGGFLGGANPWGRPAAPAPASPPGPAFPLGQSGPFSPPAVSPFSGFLGNALATAAGVAGGAFLFHGIENLLHSSDTNLAAVESSSTHHSGDLASYDDTGGREEDDFTHTGFDSGDDGFETYDDDIDSVDV